jgi:CHAP domain
MSIEATLARVSAIKQALADPAMLVGSGGVSTGGTEAPSTSEPGGAQSSFASALEQASAGYAPVTESAAQSSEAPPGAAGALLASNTPRPPAAAGSTGLLAYPAGTGSPAMASLDDPMAAPALSPLQAAGQESPGARIVAIAESQLGQAEQPPGSNESPAIAQYRSATAGAIPGAPWCAYFASWVARQAGEPIGEGGQGAGAVSGVWSWAQGTGRAIANGPGVVPKPGDLIVFGDEHVGIVRDVLPDGQIQTIEGNYENKVAANVRTPTEATGYVEMS